MPRYKPPKITREQAAGELRRAYDEGYTIGLTGEPPSPADPFLWGPWGRLKDEQRERGRNDGYEEFRRRVCAVKCSELPPPSPPPKIVFDPEFIDGGSY